MSDVGIAPPPAETPSNEVAIDPNPVSPPSPISNEAPAKTVDDGQVRHRPSRLETIQKAFEKSERERPRPKAAEAKKGHNQPPEPLEEEEKFDLRRRPKDQPRERGRFTAKAPAEGQESPAGAQSGQPGQQPGARPAPPQLHPQAPYRNPPPRMHQQAQADWHAAPESVRGEVYRMAKEFTDAYWSSRGDVEEMNQIRHFQQMARQHGTTLQKALQNYTGMEELLRRDLVAGLDLIVSNLKLRSPDGQQLGIRDVAYHILNQSPEQHKMLQSQNTQMAQSHQLAQAHQRIAQLEQRQNQAYAQQQFVYSRSAVDQFADTHPRFDELSDIIYAELSAGYPLDAAYQRAELLRPTHAAQTRSPSAQTRPADRSISGGPDGAMNGTSTRAKRPTPSIPDAVANAIKQVRGMM